MKNLNKLALGILVGALAIGFSAFKSTTVQVRYFKTTGSLLSTSASDYHYRPAGDCDPQSGKNCSFTVEQASAPALDANPTQSQVDGATIIQGSYTE